LARPGEIFLGKGKYVVEILKRFWMEDCTWWSQGKEHWVVAKHVLRYLRGTVEYGLRYLGDGEVKLQGIYKLRLGRQCNK
jgi:hypothetical protein